MLTIYVDGACSYNNDLDESKRKAGIGIYFADNDPRNISESMPMNLKPYSNNRAEIYACIRALQLVPQTVDIEICSDSRLVIDTMNGKSKKKRNQDLWLILENLCANHKIKWTKVPGHSDNYGNYMSDKFARYAITQ